MSSQTDVSALQVSRWLSNLCGVEDLRGKGKIRVADPHYFNADPTANADPDPTFHLNVIRMLTRTRTRIRTRTQTRIRIIKVM
jgi:hypothetical protein